MLTQESLKKIEYELTKYPADRRQAAVIAALRIAQTEKGWLSEEVITFVADYLGIPDIAVLEVASFYSMYQTEPVGKYKITICTNISCMLRDSDAIVHHLNQRLGIGFPQYPRPEEIIIGGKKRQVPDVLISGHHAEIERWRKESLKES